MLSLRIIAVRVRLRRGMNLYKQIIAFLPSKLGFPDVQKQHNSISRDTRMDCPFIHQRWMNCGRGFYRGAIRQMKRQIRKFRFLLICIPMRSLFLEHVIHALRKWRRAISYATRRHLSRTWMCDTFRKMSNSIRSEASRCSRSGRDRVRIISLVIPRNQTRS